MNNRTFKTISDLELIVKSRKSAVIFEIEQGQTNKNYRFSLEFTPECFDELLKHIETIANKSWGNLTPKEADSMGADYYEYYDKELDNNGYITIRQNTLLVERPSSESGKLYQFNKKKMESFIYDFRKIVISV